MNNSAQLRTGAYDQGLSARKTADISRGSLPIIFHPEAYTALPVPQGISGDFHESAASKREPERFGFKANIDQLYLWTEEESTRYLLHNIFCLR